MKPESVALAHVRGRITTAEYWAAVRPQFDFTGTCAGCEPWIEQLQRAVEAGFARLESLDRSDPFWRDTNALATVAKLSGFARHEMRADDAHVEAAWLWIAEALHAGADYLDPLPWGILRDAGELDAGFVVCTAFNTSSRWTDANVVRLSGLAKALGLREAVGAALAAFAARGAEQAAWANEVRSELIR